ncbi:hypothetical protein ACIOHO_26000 [Streptomyces sp. NPDC087849]|uniref:hypothetical protein n=1 Tax=Streptomyces sp. NPDC087849 TaxID=3365808 RepID=UPI00380E879F
MQHTPAIAHAVDSAATGLGRAQVREGGLPYADVPCAAGAPRRPVAVELSTAYGALWREARSGPVVAARRAGSDGAATDPVDHSESELPAVMPVGGPRAVEAAPRCPGAGISHLDSETAAADSQGSFGGGPRHGGFGARERGRAARDFSAAPAPVYARGSRTASR